MISVSSREARKELGLDFGVGGGRKDMEESDLEEGEACSYQSQEDCDASIDPDVALSYIDEKIQVVLGHFQKDFEGGVSAENLGAKFGGYGSFLPTHQRSPVWSHPRTSLQVNGQNAPRSPDNLQLEGGKMDILHASTAAQSMRTLPSIAGSSRLPAVKAVSTEDGINENKCTKLTSSEGLTSKYESLNIKSTNSLDQKTLKVRIKMGTDSLSTRKNAEIYSGLGLVSPSSSLDGSPSESEGFDHDPQDVSFKSPTSILQIMTSLPVLLSPLPDDFLQLTAKERHVQDFISVPVHMDDLESSGMLQHESHFVNRHRKFLGEKNMKSAEGYGSSTEVMCRNNKNGRIDSGVLSRKEQGTDALTTEQLVSKTLKLPLLSSSPSYSEDCLKGMEGPCDKLKDANKGMVREKVLSVQAQKELDLTSTEVNGFDEKEKGGPEREFVGDKDGRSIDGISIHTVKDNPQRVKLSDFKISESNVSRGRTGLSIEQIEPPKKACQRGSLDELDRMTLPVVKEHPLPGGKKSKGSHATTAGEREQEILRGAASLVPKTKKSSDVDSSACKNETEGVRVQMDPRKARDTYRDFFGELEDDDDRIDSMGNPSEDGLKAFEPSEVIDRSTSRVNCLVKEKPGVKKADRLSISEVYPKTGTNLVRCTGGAPLNSMSNVKGVPNMTAPPVVIEEYWVQCDQCHKWRLLPVGTNPDNLPEKWLCSMLNWLPDMNRCSISEEETTRAAAALYQGLASEGQSNLQNASGSVLTGGSLSTVHHPEEQQLNLSLHAVPGGKKKFVKEVSHLSNKDGSSQLSSQEKNLQSSVKSRSLNDVNKSPTISEPDVSGEMHKNKQKILNFDRGDIKNVKVKSRRDLDHDCVRSSKKVKTEGMHSTDEECIPYNNGAGKVGHSSLPSISVGKGRPKHKDGSFLSDSKYEAKDKPQVSTERTKYKDRDPLNGRSLDLGNYDIDGVKKRKMEDYRDDQTFSAGHHLPEGKISVKEDYSNCKKEKKARISKSEGRESSTSKGSGRMDKKVGHTKKQKLRQDPGSTLSQQSLDGLDCMKRDSLSMQASAAATSSSSKVSGSLKTKGSLHEVKGSPVESVSSSPMRILNADKSKNKELIAKDDTHFPRAVGSPRIYSDSEDDGRSNRSGTAKKDKSFNVAHHKSHGSSVLDFQDKNIYHTSDTKTKTPTSPNVTTSHFTTGGVKTVGEYDTCPTMGQIKDQSQGEDGPDIYCANPSYPRKTEREFSSHLKDNSQNCKSEFDAEKFKNASSLGHLESQSPPPESKHLDGKGKLQEKCVSKAGRSENMNDGKKESTGNLSNKSREEDNQLNNGGHGLQEVSVVAICKQESLSVPGQNQFLDCDAERSSKHSLSEGIDQEVLGKGKSLSVPPSRGAQSETSCPPPVVGFHNGNGDMAVDPSKADDASNMHKKQIRTNDHQNGGQHISSRHPMLNGHKTEIDAPSPIRKVSSSHAANNALKEAKNLKHLADRLKHSGSIPESTGLYFQAALKFLHGASLLESGNNENAKHNEMIQSKQVYSSTAKLCQFCAHEYERSKDMAGAALAYKCMEVAYLRVIYSSHTSASRDRHVLQSALQIVPRGESPSSSASDVDNVNNSTTVDKISCSKDVNSPQVAGTNVVAAQNGPKFVRLLNFAQDVHFAMEASRKSRGALAAACACLGGPKHADAFSSIKKALDFNFQDVDGLLRLVRLAMEALNR